MPTWRAHSLTIHPDGAVGAVHIPDVTNMGMDINPEFNAELVAQSGMPLHVNVKAVKPKASLTGFALKNLLDEIGVSGLGFTGATNPGMVFNWAQFSDVGELVAGSNHRSQTIHTGVIYPTKLTVKHGEDAKLEVEIVPIKTSGNACVVSATSVALPTITIASLRWTLGPMTIAGVALSEYNSLEIDFGNKVEVQGTASDPYATHIEQRTHEPTIKIMGIDPAWFHTTPVPLGGAALTIAGDSIFLRKRTQDGTHFVGDATAEHLKFTFAGIGAAEQALRAEAQKIGETGLMLKLGVDSSGNNPIIVDTAAAISA